MTTLLYVDDEETIGRVVDRYFSRRGDIVLHARSIAEACAILETSDPKVVFIDLYLGPESGYELMNWIEDTRPHLLERVTFVTGELPNDDGPDRSWKALRRPVIQKPFDLSTLAKSVDQAVSRAAT